MARVGKRPIEASGRVRVVAFAAVSAKAGWGEK